MKKLLLPALLSLLSFSFQAQVILDTLGDLQKDVDLYHGAISKNPSEFYTIVSSSTNPYQILLFDDNLQLIDTVIYSNYRRKNPIVSRVITFRGKPYALFGNTMQTNRRMNLQLLDQNTLTDSFYISVDTLQYFSIYHAYEAYSNTLRLFVNSYDASYSSIKGSYIYDLDSTFKAKMVYPINLNYSPTSSKTIVSVTEVNDTLWHVHTIDNLYGYNPQSKSLLFSKYLKGQIYKYLNLNDSTYLGFGISTVLGTPPLRSTSQSALGYYKIDKYGNAIDTTSFNAYSQLINMSNYIDYSDERGGGESALIYDTNNIILASSSTYFLPGEPQQQDGFLVLRADVNGKEYWRFEISSSMTLTYISSILKTNDNGCILIGSYSPIPNNIFHRNGIIIKLGPDGTISNVELDAPETVISFYPNPVKDKLYYNYLPEANGKCTLEIIDMQGKPVQDVVLENEKGYIPVSLQSGFYLYHLKSENGKVEQVGRLVVE